jgi:hypothetical protein
MDGLSAAASGMAVVSLAIQLVGSVRDIHRLVCINTLRTFSIREIMLFEKLLYASMKKMRGFGISISTAGVWYFRGVYNILLWLQ